jgi:hypothetical protein
MAIANLDAVIAGMQPPNFFAKALSGNLVAGRHQSFWPVAGIPGAGAYNATLNGANLDSSSSIPAGALRHVDPVSGAAYLARLSACATQAGVLMLMDRLWQGRLTVNSTSAQNITQPTLPARDNNGSTNGEGVLLAVETEAAASATAATVTATYTNSAGTGSRTANFAASPPTAAVTVAGGWFPIGLQAGDIGVRSVQTIQFGTAWSTGTIDLVAYRLLASVELPGALIPGAIDAITGGMPRLYNGVVPFLVFLPNTTTSTSIIGSEVETQG